MYVTKALVISEEEREILEKAIAICSDVVDSLPMYDTIDVFNFIYDETNAHGKLEELTIRFE